LLSLIPIANTYLQRNILNPILIFIEHMDSIRDNDFSSELTENMGSMEMDHMAASFNTMIHRIQTMKIELYEKELQRTQLDLQCLQLQLSPHFFINTLNTIYFLSINEENLQLQSLTLDFMEYFRAVFKGSSSLKFVVRNSILA
jgi:two-component system, sensor histidine kinase YesM